MSNREWERGGERGSEGRRTKISWETIYESIPGVIYRLDMNASWIGSIMFAIHCDVAGITLFVAASALKQNITLLYWLMMK